MKVYDTIQTARNLRIHWDQGNHRMVAVEVKSNPALGVVLGNLLPQMDMVELLELMLEP